MTFLHKASDIANELSSRLATITKAGGYNTDVGGTVLRGRRRIDDSQIPCVVIIEGDDRPTAAPGRTTQANIEQSYILVAYDKCSANHPNDKAHLLITDLKKSVFGDGATLGDKVRQVTYVGRDIGPRGDGVDIVCATVEISVRYVEDLADA